MNVFHLQYCPAKDYAMYDRPLGSIIVSLLQHDCTVHCTVRPQKELADGVRSIYLASYNFSIDLFLLVNDRFLPQLWIALKKDRKKDDKYQ